MSSTTKSYNTIKRVKHSLYGKSILIILIITILFASCSSSVLKKEVISETDKIMELLSTGNYEAIPVFKKAIGNLDQKKSESLQQSFKEFTKWDIKVLKINENNATVKSEVMVNNNHMSLFFSFNRVNGKWVLQDNIAYDTEIEIPFIELDQDK